MSFTSTIKNEVSKLTSEKIENIAELSAFLKNSSTTTEMIRITTENASVARHIFHLMKQLYGVVSKITVRHGYNYNKNYVYILEITKRVPEFVTEHWSPFSALFIPLLHLFFSLHFLLI